MRYIVASVSKCIASNIYFIFDSLGQLLEDQEPDPLPNNDQDQDTNLTNNELTDINVISDSGDGKPLESETYVLFFNIFKEAVCLIS